MWRFVLKENIRRLRALIVQAQSDAERQKLWRLAEQDEAELREIEEASTPDLARNDTALAFLAGRVVDDAMKLHGAQFGSLQIYDESREHLVILAQRNFRAPFLRYLSSIKPGDGSACGSCLSNDATAAVGDVNSDPAFEPHRSAASEAGFLAVQASPVRDGSGSAIAVLSTYYTAPRSFTVDELDRMSLFADSIGPSLARHLQR